MKQQEFLISQVSLQDQGEAKHLAQGIFDQLLHFIVGKPVAIQDVSSRPYDLPPAPDVSIPGVSPLDLRPLYGWRISGTLSGDGEAIEALFDLINSKPPLLPVTSTTAAPE